MYIRFILPLHNHFYRHPLNIPARCRFKKSHGITSLSRVFIFFVSVEPGIIFVLAAIKRHSFPGISQRPWRIFLYIHLSDKEQTIPSCIQDADPPDKHFALLRGVNALRLFYPL